MVSKNYKHHPEIRKDIQKLYVSAFPRVERPPVNMFFNEAKKSDNELLGFYLDNRFIGFTNLLFYKDLCYMFFLAVSPEYRNEGFGSQIIQEAFKEYPDKTFVLCYDEVDEKYSDNNLRIRRRNFYLRNGFKDNNLKTLEYGVRYDTVYHGHHQIPFEDYLGLMIHCYGPLAKKYIKKASS